METKFHQPQKGTFTLPYLRGHWVLHKTWKEGSPADQLNPEWKGPYQVVLSTPVAVKLLGVHSRVHISKGKLAPSDPDPTQDQLETRSPGCTSARLEGLRFPFRRRKP